MPTTDNHKDAKLQTTTTMLSCGVFMPSCGVFVLNWNLVSKSQQFRSFGVIQTTAQMVRLWRRLPGWKTTLVTPRRVLLRAWELKFDSLNWNSIRWIEISIRWIEISIRWIGFPIHRIHSNPFNSCNSIWILNQFASIQFSELKSKFDSVNWIAWIEFRFVQFAQWIHSLVFFRFNSRRFLIRGLGGAMCATSRDTQSVSHVSSC